MKISIHQMTHLSSTQTRQTVCICLYSLYKHQFIILVPSRGQPHRSMCYSLASMTEQKEAPKPSEMRRLLCYSEQLNAKQACYQGIPRLVMLPQNRLAGGGGGCVSEVMEPTGTRHLSQGATMCFGDRGTIFFPMEKGHLSENTGPCRPHPGLRRKNTHPALKPETANVSVAGCGRSCSSRRGAYARGQTQF